VPEKGNHDKALRWIKIIVPIATLFVAIVGSHYSTRYGLETRIDHVENSLGSDIRVQAERIRSVQDAIKRVEDWVSRNRSGASTSADDSRSIVRFLENLQSRIEDLEKR